MMESIVANKGTLRDQKKQLELVRASHYQAIDGNVSDAGVKKRRRY